MDLSADVILLQHALAARQAVVARVRAVDAAPVRRAPPNRAGSTGCRARCRARRTRRCASSGRRTRSTARDRDRRRVTGRGRAFLVAALGGGQRLLVRRAQRRRDHRDVARLAERLRRARGRLLVGVGGMTGCASGGFGNLGATDAAGGVRDAARRRTATATATATPTTPAPMMMRGLRRFIPLPPSPTCTGESIGRARDRLDPALHYAAEQRSTEEAVMPVRYRSRTVKKETLHTVSLLTPHLEPGASVLDIGCGEGYVLDELVARGVTGVQGVDIVDIRAQQGLPVPPVRRRDAAVSRSQLRPRRPQLRAAPRPERAEAGADRGGAARQPRQGRRRRGHAVDGVRPR